MSELKFVVSTSEERALLLSALEIKPPYICHYCNKEVELKDLSVMPPVEGDKKVTLLCRGIFCMSKYLTETED